MFTALCQKEGMYMFHEQNMQVILRQKFNSLIKSFDSNEINRFKSIEMYGCQEIS